MPHYAYTQEEVDALIATVPQGPPGPEGPPGPPGTSGSSSLFDLTDVSVPVTPKKGDALVHPGGVGSSWGVFSIVGMPLRLERYGASLDGTGVGDDAAFAAAIQDAKNRTWRTSRIQWNGVLTLSQSPPSLYRIHLEGDDIYGSTIHKGYAGGVLLNFAGPAGFTGGGLHNFSVPTQPGSANSYIIRANATTEFSPDGLILEDLYLSSGVEVNAPFRNIEVVGDARLSPPGIRGLVLRNVTCFGATGGNVFLSGVSRIVGSGLSTYKFGPGTDADVYVRGAPAFIVEDNYLSGCDIEGNLRLSRMNKARFQGSIASVISGANLTNVFTGL